MKKFNRTIKRFLALCLCAALLCGAACAEEIRTICTGLEELYYRYTLPDGRVLMTGSKIRPDPASYDDKAAWVVCLNPDRTMSWEFADTGENGYVSAVQAAALQDGTVAVVFEDRQLLDRENRLTVRFFTQDGKETGKELELSTKLVTFKATPSWLMLYGWKPEERMDETILIDWGGNELLRYDGLILPDGYGFAVGNTDELVLYGQDTMENSHAKILKLDGLTDSVLWETTLDWQLSDTEAGTIDSCVRTDDGGYLAMVGEARPETDENGNRWTSFLVKLDKEGRVLWTSREIFEKYKILGSRMYFLNGKLLLSCASETGGDPGSIAPWVFLWLDGDGNELGMTEVELKAEDLPHLSQYVGPAGDGTYWEPFADVLEIIPMADGLWALGQGDVDLMDGEKFLQTLPEASETFLVKIPEP